MAIVNDENKYIFIHIYKTGGNAIRRTISGKEYTPAHITCKALKDKIFALGQTEKWNTYLKFAVVRDPIDWMVSLYFYITHSVGHPDFENVKNMTFSEFNVWHRNYPLKPGWHHEYNTQSSFLMDGNKFYVDKILRFEHLQFDYNDLCETLKIETAIIPLENVSPWRKKGTKEYVSEKDINIMMDYLEADFKLYNTVKKEYTKSKIWSL